MRILPAILISACLLTQSGYSQAPLKSFPLSSVRLLESPFKKAQETDMKYMLAIDPDRLLAPYRREAGIESKAQGYGNWEGTGLDGHIGGHYLSALSFMYASTGNKEVLQRLNYMIDALEICQQKNGDGYIGGVPGGKTMWQDIAQGRINSGAFSLNDKWVPLYNIHKLYAGLIDAYQVAGNTKAKGMLIKFADWCLKLTSGLSNDQVQRMLRSEHGGMNEAFADVAAITGDNKYLDLARKFSHLTILNPLLEKRDVLNGQHANTQIPKVIGYMRIAEVSGDRSWANAADFFWKTVVENRTVSIGGNSVREHFNPANDFSSMMETREGPETCNTYNMLKLTRHLFLSAPSVSYMDYYERALYNHILSSQHPDGGFVYFTPLRPRHYRVYSEPDQAFWCCVGSGLENHGKYGELIYAHNDKDIYVNLFIPSTLEWKEKGMKLVQNTKFPFSEKSEIKLELKKSAKFALKLRYPSWVKKGEMRPMHTSVEFLPDNSSWASIIHGPIVLAAATEKTDMPGLRADDSRFGHIANGALYPLETAPMIVSSEKDFSQAIIPVKDKPLTFKASSLIYPDKYKDVELVPFFQVHDSRYMLYWTVTKAEDLENVKQAIRKNEELRLALELITVDHVAPGEQQPESDHSFRGENTEAGTFNDQHWRSATGWFSYDLKDPDNQARKLRVTYYGGDRNRNFDIYINDVLFQTVKLDGSAGNKFFDVDYNLPDEIIKNTANKTLKLKFVANTGSTAGGVYYVRLLK